MDNREVASFCMGLIRCLSCKQLMASGELRIEFEANIRKLVHVPLTMTEMVSSPVLMLATFHQDEDTLYVPLSTLITFFSLSYCEVTGVDIVLTEDDTGGNTVQRFRLPADIITILRCHTFTGKPEQVLLDCKAPAVFLPKLSTCIGGLAAVIRWAIVQCTSQTPDHFSKPLLGFRGSSLAACSESSLWTRFCEIDIQKAVHALCTLSQDDGSESFVLPEQLLRLEAHLRHPVRTHNIRRRQQEVLRQREGPAKRDCSSLPVLEHQYVEGYDMTLADVMLFSCIFVSFSAISSTVEFESLSESLPLTVKWYNRMLSNQHTAAAVALLGLENAVVIPGTVARQVHLEPAELPQDNLYSRNPDRSKPRIRHKCPQGIIDRLYSSGIDPQLEPNPARADLPLPWDSYPTSVHPTGGGLPNDRVVRKCQQIENLVALVLRYAYPGNTIVDFCSGGGHVGVVLAYLLPECTVIMIENKEESMLRARKRTALLGLNNVTFYQCNMDYFHGAFDIGVSLHACGVATDLVIQKCIGNNAVFVSCPCCYGSMKRTDDINYPLSEVFRASGISSEDYVLLCHYADRTEQNTATCEKGRYCMGLVDRDRAYWAEESRYAVLVTEMFPRDCSPKCHILVGTPA